MSNIIFHMLNMSKPKMNCWGEFPEWTANEAPEWVVFDTPQSCKVCEFYMACTLNRSQQILWFSDSAMSQESMTQLALFQRLVESEVLLTDGITLEQLRAKIEARWKTKH